MNNNLNKIQNDETLNGIIIKSYDYKENSKLLYILTSDGLINLEAKGANISKSKNNTYTKVLTNISFNYSRHTITTGKVLENFTNIKCDIKRFEEATKIIEMCYTLAEHITDFKIFYDFVLKCLKEINYSEFYLYIDYVFRTKLLYLLGLAPVLKKCVNCNSDNKIIGFSLDDGGFICFDCAKNIKNLYNDKFIEVFKYFYFTKFENIDYNLIRDNYDSNEFNKFNKFLDKYYELYLGYISKSKKIFDKINN